MSLRLISNRLLPIVALVATLPFSVMTSDAFAAAPQVRKQAPGFYRMMLGNFEITALLDGTHPFPSNVLTKPDASSDLPEHPRKELLELDPEELETLLGEVDLSSPVEGAINAFLVNTGRKLILIDSGAGILYGVYGGHLLGNLAASGYSPDQIDEVYLTHLHADHVGGMLHDGKMSFPNATVRVRQEDYDYWLDRSKQAAAPALLKTMFDGAISSLQPYLDLGRVKPYEGSVELSPGIRSIPAPGHTPGHSFYEVTSGTSTMVMWGDIVHMAPVQFPDPSVTVAYDSDGDSAEKQREGIFAEAAAKGYWIGAAHVSFPGIGHVGSYGGTFRWIPANYTTVLPAPTE